MPTPNQPNIGTSFADASRKDAASKDPILAVANLLRTSASQLAQSAPLI
jgi:hypothetical protein